MTYKFDSRYRDLKTAKLIVRLHLRFRRDAYYVEVVENGRTYYDVMTIEQF